MKFEKVINLVEEILEKKLYFKKDIYGFYGQKIYCDYKDELSDSIIEELLKSNKPMEALQNLLMDWAANYALEYEEVDTTNLMKEIKINFPQSKIFEENKDKIKQWINDNIYYYYPLEHFNKEINVNITVDTGDANYDFMANKLLYNLDALKKYAKYSSIVWLAKTQGKSTKLKKVIREYIKSKKLLAAKEENFIKSVINEIENMNSDISTLIFMVKMPLFEFFNLKYFIHKEKNINLLHTPKEKNEKSYIKISKETTCGLADLWNGVTSLLDIKLEKDVKLPVEYIYDIFIDSIPLGKYGINEICGLIDSCWSGDIKEIRKAV